MTVCTPAVSLTSDAGVSITLGIERTRLWLYLYLPLGAQSLAVPQAVRRKSRLDNAA